jgi:hypothetical protein
VDGGKPRSRPSRERWRVRHHAIAREARRLHEIVKVQRAKLAYERERGDLVNRSAVKVAVYARAKAERNAHMAWVARVTPLLAAELGADPARTFAALDRLMREHLVDLARIPLPELRDG